MKKLLLFVALVFPFTLEAQDFFKYVSEQKAFAQISNTEGVLSVRRIDLDSDVLRYSSFAFPAGDGYKMAFRSEDVEERANGNFTSRFRVGTSDGISTVTNNFGHVAGIIHTEDKVFEIRPDGDGHILLEYSSMSFECGAHAVDVGTSFLESTTTALTSGRRRSVGRGGVVEPSLYEIDLAEGYMSTAAAAVGGRLQIEAIIRNAVDTLNTSVRNSSISNVKFNLAGMREFSFDDSGDTTQIMARLASNQEINSWRDGLGADLVGMWLNRRVSAAYIPYGTSFARNTSFHVASANSASTPVGLIYAHEVGHNMGMEHDRANANVNDPSASNYGWYDCMAGWATLMSYQNQVCANINVAEPKRIPYFSNPDVKYNGLPTGIAKANNAGRLMFSAPHIASYSPTRSN